MPSQTDVREVEKGTAKKKRRFDKRDFDLIAEWVVEERDRRKKNRKDLEKHWDEIDRQILMDPDLAGKIDTKGKVIKGREWMSEVEAPFQAQTLEVLTADARKLLFPSSGPWFRAHSALTDEYLERVDFKSLITGDENEVPSRVNQDNADQLVAGVVANAHRKYKFRDHIDLINTESFKYGVGVGRGKLLSASAFIQEARGVRREDDEIPVLFPRSIRNTYLDDRESSIMNEGFLMSPTIIAEERLRLADIQFKANKGSNDPENPNGGWMPKNLKGVEEDDKKGIDVIEVEGDLIVPRTTVRSIVIRGAIATVIIGRVFGKSKAVVVRFRFRKTPYSSYLTFPYHAEDLADSYATSPLMKGRPIQVAASQSLNRFLDAAALRNGPPVGFDRDDVTFAKKGGPTIEPYALWDTLGEVKVHQFADPSAMREAFLAFTNLYMDLTGVNAARLGQQTRSHTTAFAKDTEIQRSALRSVDYASATGAGPITQWLHMAYDMIKRSMNEKRDIYVDAYGGWVNVNKDDLPDLVEFDWIGSAGPADEQSRDQKKFNAAQLALQIDQIAVSQGKEPTLDPAKLIQELLRDGGWVDIDAITRDEGVLDGASPASAVPGDAANDPRAASAALQALAFGQR